MTKRQRQRKQARARRHTNGQAQRRKDALAQTEGMSFKQQRDIMEMYGYVRDETCRSGWRRTATYVPAKRAPARR